MLIAAGCAGGAVSSIDESVGAGPSNGGSNAGVDSAVPNVSVSPDAGRGSAVGVFGDASAIDGSTTGPSPPPSDASVVDASIEGSGPVGVADCDPLAGGTPMPTALPPFTGVTYTDVHWATASSAGVYLSFTATGFRNPDTYGIHFVPADGSAPTTIDTPLVYFFVVAGGHAYYPAAGDRLMSIDLTTGASADSGLALQAEKFITLRPTDTHLYWPEEVAPGEWRVVRSAISSDGSLGTPETLAGATDAASFWFVDQNETVFLWPVGASDPVPFGEPEWPEWSLDVAIGTSYSFLAVGGYGPSRDGGCIGTSCTTYPGPLLGAEVFRRAHDTGAIETLFSSSGQVYLVAATDAYVYWDEHLSYGSGACVHLWRARLDGTSLTLLSRNEASRGRRDLLTVDDVIYYVQGGAIARFGPD